MEEILKSGIQYIKGVGESRAALLNKLGIFTVEDMLYFFPRFIEDRSNFKKISELKHGETACVKAIAASSVQENKLRKGLTIYSLIIKEGFDAAVVTWFNNKFVKDAFEIDKPYIFYGKVSIKFGKIELVNPIYEKGEGNLFTGRVVPIYPLTNSLYQKSIQSIAKNCLELLIGKLKEYLPQSIRKEHNLCEINYALSSIHFPNTIEDYNIARYRLVFEEFLLLSLGLLLIRGKRQELKGTPLNNNGYLNEFLQKLPFKLTNAQEKVINEIHADLNNNKPMSRLVQGDVGSGKTVVAFAAIYTTLKNGYQATMMAPTEILARQHYETATVLFSDYNVVLLTGSVTGKAKKEALNKIKSGVANIIIGTHSLIEDTVEFERLALVVTDEQHRFGVRQRVALTTKGESPHVLVMSATPIPRTLALILYGDLDISIVNELPPGRQNVDTFVVDEDKRKRVYDFVSKQIQEGRQAYVVCPLVEESESMDLRAATQLACTLREQVFPGLTVELLHGKMKPKQKDEIMNSFSQGKINILVSTTVIEVGINVPNASIMIVENAERFGLSQLHQLRGRVGRGEYKSYCVLFNCGVGKVTSQRLGTMAKTNDGFLISQKDLELRGPGDFFGTRQHGLPDLKIANIFNDMELLKKAQKAADGLIKKDPNLEQEDNIILRDRLVKMYSKGAYCVSD